MLKDFINVISTKKQSNKYPVLVNVIPEFDPSTRSQTIEMWLSKVNECATMYEWSECQIIHYAIPKLTGVAQRWYQGLPSVLFSWEQWQQKLKTAFPSDQNYGQLLQEMLDCKAKFGESLEEYFYNKIVLLNRCKIFGKQAVECVLFGIEDRSVRTGAEAVQFSEPDKLLVFLRNVKTFRRQEKNIKASAPEQSLKSKIFRQNIKCYNCGEEGHPSFRCKIPLKKCDLCLRLGHLRTNCPRGKNETNQSENKVL